MNQPAAPDGHDPGDLPSAGRYALGMFGFLTIMALYLFTLMVSVNVHLRTSVQHRLFESCVAVWLLLSALIARPIWRSGMEGFAGPLIGGGMLAIFASLGLYGLTSTAGLFTAKATLRVVTPITMLHYSGRCPVAYAFDNPPLGRSMEICGKPYPGAQTGDLVEVDEKSGPLGIVLGPIARAKPEEAPTLPETQVAVPPAPQR